MGFIVFGDRIMIDINNTNIHWKCVDAIRAANRSVMSRSHFRRTDDCFRTDESHSEKGQQGR